MEPILGQISIFPFSIVPKGWALCDGSVLQIQSNPALYSLIGTFYGGDGRTTFAIPDLRGRVPVCNIYGTNPGSKTGQEEVALTVDTTPEHSHQIAVVSANGISALPNECFLANIPDASAPLYAPGTTVPEVTLSAGTIGQAGSGSKHMNIQPSLVLSFCIAISGIYPQRP